MSSVVNNGLRIADCGVRRIAAGQSVPRDLRSIWTLTVLVSLLAALSGCPPTPPRMGIAPRDAGHALERINQNTARVNQPLYAKVLVSLRFRDANGVNRRLWNQDGYLVFSAPRCLRLDVKSLAGVIAQLGSNKDRYWIWIEPEVNTLWWGQWTNAARARTERLPISPTDLLDTLMLGRVPEKLQSSAPAALRIDGPDQRLIYVRLDGQGHAGGMREIRLQPDTPYQPAEIIDRGPDGNIWMRAELSDYQPVMDGGPFTPRKYKLEWPRGDAELRIDVQSAKFRPELEDFCDFPGGWKGQVEPIDSR